MSEDCEIKILDFGLSRPMADQMTGNIGVSEDGLRHDTILEGTRGHAEVDSLRSAR